LKTFPNRSNFVQSNRVFSNDRSRTPSRTASWVLGAALAASGCSQGTEPPNAAPSSTTPNVSPSVTPTTSTSTAPGTTGAPVTVTVGPWDQGLTVGPNGPIPVIVVDQFGYRTADPKVAVLRNPQQGYDAAVEYTPGAEIALVDAATNIVVKSGVATPWNNGNVESRSGDLTWSFDFSEIITAGKYFVFDAQNNVRSPDFEIGDDVYKQVLHHAFRTFYYQRVGFEKAAAFAGAEWADGASHVGPQQDGEARSWLEKENAETAKDLHGGWYDAGDYNKYTNWHTRYIINLLRAFAFYPNAFGDDFAIPESGNGIPDVLDEVKFGVEWLVRMQNADGSVLCIQGLGTGTPPSSVTEASYYGPPSTSATLSAAAAFAYAARIFGARTEPDFVALAADLKARAVSAWQWADSNPDVTYFNNDDSKQEGSAGLAAGQQEIDDDGRLALKVEAAAYLFQQTGEAAYRDFFDANYADVTPTYLSHWQVDRHEAALDYAAQTGATPAVAEAIRAEFSGLFLGNSGFLQAARTNEDPYRSKIDQFTWGSNQSKGAAGRVMLLNGEYEVDAATVAESNAVATNYIHYVHGLNPLGLVYLTNMATAGAEHSAKTLYHSWFAHTSDVWSEVTPTTPGPAPGFLVGGPNPMYELDACCTDDSECYGSEDFSFCSMTLVPPLDQPDAKAYLQFNLGWPANSWAVTENSNGYQTQYIRLLAASVN
jgi:endoglucanase